MEKKAALHKIREKFGYIPYVSFYEMFDDEIPDNIVDYALTQNNKPQTNFIICSPQIAKELNNLNINK
jgi:hypothetical protein